MKMFSLKSGEIYNTVVLSTEDETTLVIQEINNHFVINIKDTSIKSCGGDIYFKKYTAKDGVIKEIIETAKSNIKD